MNKHEDYLLYVLFFFLGVAACGAFFQVFVISEPPTSISPENLTIRMNSDSLILEFHGNYSVLYSAEGSSMHPVMNGKSTMILDYNTDNIQKYDIVGLKNEDYYILHQIVGIDADCYYTRGTHNLFSDGICWKKENIQYRVVNVAWTG